MISLIDELPHSIVLAFTKLWCDFMLMPSELAPCFKSVISECKCLWDLAIPNMWLVSLDTLEL